MNRDDLRPSCEYDLTGNLSGRCPECGQRYDPAMLLWKPEPLQIRFFLVGGALVVWLLGSLLPIWSGTDYGCTGLPDEQNSLWESRDVIGKPRCIYH